MTGLFKNPEFDEISLEILTQWCEIGLEEPGFLSNTLRGYLIQKAIVKYLVDHPGDK